MDDMTWWKRGILYQIYPLSFMDSNGDGRGDLRGIESKLDYLEWLGVDALWLSPIYTSPMADFGYDIANYTDVEPRFGTLADFDRLVSAVHRRGMRLVLDFVPNHTSDQHPWFLESRSLRTSDRRDWYLWADALPDGGPPNNWLSVFGGSGWEWDSATEQYYYHSFLKEQPDLNWRNPEVQGAMHDVMRFWLDRGVDGFRVDVMAFLVKDAQLRDNPVDPTFHAGLPAYREFVPIYSTNQPEVHDIVAEMRRIVDCYSERLLIGEIYLPIRELVAYYGSGTGAHLPFNFHLIKTPWSARRFEAVINEYEAALPQGSWPNWVLGNHDKSRLATRIGPEQARAAAILLLTLRGTPTLYYGDELGMRDVPFAPHELKDPYEIRVPGFGLGRDPCRTPMQWSDAPNAGFTSGTPWLKVATDFAAYCVAAEEDDPGSLLSLYRRLIALRRAEPALQIGSHEPVVADGDVLAYMREHNGRRFLVALNFGSEATFLGLDSRALHGQIRISAHIGRADERVGNPLSLAPHDGLVVELD